MGMPQAQNTVDSGVAIQGKTQVIVPAQSLTNSVASMRQLRIRAQFLGASIYARSYTATLGVDVGYVPVGRAVAAITLVIATTVSRFKINAAIIGISATNDANTGLPKIVNKAVTDNLPFSAAYTINTAAAAGQFWGAFRIQMDSTGAISTRAVAQDQVFTVEADAIANCPAAASNMVDLGTITIRSATGAAFICNTTSLVAAGTTVNYNGKASGFTSITTASMAPVALTLVQGTLVAKTVARTPRSGCLLVVRYTSDGTMAVTELSVNLSYRPYPLNSEG